MHPIFFSPILFYVIIHVIRNNNPNFPSNKEATLISPHKPFYVPYTIITSGSVVIKLFLKVQKYLKIISLKICKLKEITRERQNTKFGENPRASC